jgi:outer membrane protein TolC
VQELPTGGALVLSSDFSRDVTRPATPSVEYTSTVLLSLVQPLLRGGRIYVATQPIRNAEFDARVADNALKSQILQVTAGTKAAYYGVLLAEKVIDVTEAAIERDRALVAASEALFQARIVTKRDVFSAELSLAQDTARLVSARADLETAKNVLGNILGLSIATDIVLIDKEIPFSPVRVELDPLIATAMDKRPEMLSIQEQLAKSTLNIKVARNALLAQVDFVASYGKAHTRPTFSRSLDLSGDVWSVGFVFSYPLGNVAARATLTQAEIEHSRLELARIQIQRQIELEVRAAVITLQKNLERIKALTIAIEQAKGKLEVGKAQFALGQATNLDITDAQQAILDAETDLLIAIVDYNVGLADLEASIAGPLPPQ